MSNLTIKKHSFEVAKNRLKEFSEKTEAQLAINKVRTDGGFLGLGDHKVTGNELNNRLETIQKHFIDVNTTNNKVIKEFREIYNALDALDKDYITSIIANVKAIEKTSNDVRVQQGTLKQHNEKLATQQNKLDAHQTEIEKNVSNISKIVTVLKGYKEKLESYNHLTDIDKMWNDCQKWHKDLSMLSSSLSEAMALGEKNTEAVAGINQDLEATYGKIASLSDSLSEQIERIESIITFISEMETIAHLKDTDIMWDRVEDNDKKLETLDERSNNTIEEVKKNQTAIAELGAYKQELSAIVHLKDVDVLWDKVEDNDKKVETLDERSNNTIEEVKKNQTAIAELGAYKQELSAIVHLKDTDILWDTTEKHIDQIEKLENQGEESRKLIQYNKELADQSLVAEREKTDSALQQINKKIQRAYWIAGGSLGLALVELFVILLG